MVSRLQALHARVFPQGARDAALQLALFALAYYGYRLVRGAVYGNFAVTNLAYEHARHIIGLERSLHLFVEPAIQAWTERSTVLIDVASLLYVNSHFTVTFVALVFLYRFRNDSFYFVRNMFMIAMGLALVLYLVYPTAPPRFLPEWGFQDSVTRFTGGPGPVNALFNPFAAVPSMHVAFALMVGWPLARLVRPRALRIIFALYPALVTWVVVATGNHFWMDALLGALTAGVSALVAHGLLARARPVWALNPVATPA